MTKTQSVEATKSSLHKHCDSAAIDISIVIPVYNAAGCLQELYKRIVNTLEDLEVKYEIIMVEDCGADNSWNIILELATSKPYLKGYKLSRNYGQHNAITAGLDRALGDWTVIMDCDLQDRPEDIPRLLEKAREGYDVVIARNVHRRQSLFKQIAAQCFYKTFSWLAGYQYQDGVRSFRIMSRNVTEALISMREQMRSIGPLGIWIGFSTTYLNVELEPRYAGNSSYSVSRLFKLAFSNIVAFSDKPLRISISIGFIMAACAFSYGLYTVLRAMFQDIPVPGWTSLITSLYFIGGLILVNLGVLGIYLGKTFDEAKHRPLYLISQTTMSESTPGNPQTLLKKENKHESGHTPI